MVLVKSVSGVEAAGFNALPYAGPVSYERFQSVIRGTPDKKRKNVLVLLVTLAETQTRLTGSSGSCAGLTTK